MNWWLLLGLAAFASVTIPILVRLWAGGRDHERGKWQLVAMICMLNFLAFWLLAVLLGGTAWLGARKGGYYFLGNHGRLTRVDSWVYWYSMVHTTSQLLTFPLAIFAGYRASEERDDKESNPSIRGRGAA